MFQVDSEVTDPAHTMVHPMKTVIKTKVLIVGKRHNLRCTECTAYVHLSCFDSYTGLDKTLGVLVRFELDPIQSHGSGVT